MSVHLEDEVSEAKQRRWLRQLAEVVGETIRAEVPEAERLASVRAFCAVLTATTLEIGHLMEAPGATRP